MESLARNCETALNTSMEAAAYISMAVHTIRVWPLYAMSHSCWPRSTCSRPCIELWLHLFWGLVRTDAAWECRQTLLHACSGRAAQPAAAGMALKADTHREGCAAVRSETIAS